MLKRSITLGLTSGLAIALLGSVAAAQASDWNQLFNGKDLTGWDVYLNPATKQDKAEAASESIGLNPEGQTTVVVQPDGSVRLEGRIWGGMNTKESYRDYHFRLETRWGEAKFAPRLDRQRDSGIIFHAQLPHGAFGGHWMGGCEYQVQERDFGDFYPLTTPRVTTYLDPQESKVDCYAPNGMVKEGHQKRVQRSVKREMPHGEWNVCEVIARHDEVVHITNGLVNNRYSHVRDRTAKTETVLDSGMIQLQSEGAEVFYRKIELRSLGKAALSRAVCPFDAPSAEVRLTLKPQTVTFTNRGDRATDVVAFELIGRQASEVIIDLPNLPTSLKPGESITVQVSRADGPGSLHVDLRVETLAGPATSQALLR